MIPTRFRGGQVAMVEAKYAGGTNAGPNSWTSCTEYAVTYVPNHSGDQIVLRPEFFAEVNAAPLSHSPSISGVVCVTYRAAKNGSTVTSAA